VEDVRGPARRSRTPRAWRADGDGDLVGTTFHRSVVEPRIACEHRVRERLLVELLGKATSLTEGAQGPRFMSQTRGSSRQATSAASFNAWLRRQRFAFVYVVLAASFVLHVARFHDRQTGFTPLILFGDRFASQRLARLGEWPIYTYADSDGYDGQFYAQIAVAGDPFDPELRTALDSPAYRTRRILLPMLAHIAGLGRPVWVLAAYALSNVISWLILAWVTARWWFPPTSVDNLLRWSGTLFGAGMLVSVTRSLTDGPALLVIALGMRCLEQNRHRLAAAGLLGAAGLVRETSVLVAAAFLPPNRSFTAWRGVPLAVAACVLPAIAWVGILSVHYGAISTGALGWPGVGLFKELETLGSVLRTRGFWAAKDDLFVVAATSVQVGFLVSGPRPALAWWRVGAAFAVLALFLGPGFWDDAIAGVPRTLLPLTLAFNVLAQRTRAGLALLVAGNLTVLSVSSSFDVVPTEQTVFTDEISCNYASGWHDPEHLGRRTWRWAAGSAVLMFRNPLPKSARVGIDFEMRSETPRTVTLRANDAVLVVSLPARGGLRQHFGPLELPPGVTSLAIDTNEPPWTEPGPRGRPLSFALENLRLTPVPHRDLAAIPSGRREVLGPSTTEADH
jgi:hypothetical protein